VRTCIYCLVAKPDEAFNREHVMPQGFGTFDHNFVLHDVCLDCNGTMGREIETPGIRGSFEGIHRHITAQLASVKSLVKAPRSRVTFEIDDPGFKGVQAYHEPAPDGPRTVVMFEPQVVADYHDGSYRSFRLQELTDAAPLQNALAFRVYALTDDEVTTIVEALHRLGVKPKWAPMELNDSEDGTTLVKVSALYDDIVRRLMAKITFNYLTHVAGAAYVLKAEFNTIREFIRYGRGRGADLAGPIEEPMLFEEQSAGGYSITEDHLVGVARMKNGGLLGQVSLFNQIHHVVILSQTNPDVIEMGLIPSGHRFNWKTRTIDTLRGWAEDNLVQPADVIARRRGR
jgi:hypothetical protein